MKIAVVTDIHGNLPALDAVRAAIAREGCDMVVNLGDIVSGPLWPHETAQALRALGWPTLRGNHERWVLGERATMGPSDAYAADRLDAADRAWLATLPPTLELADGDVLCCHGTPASDLVYCLETTMPNFGVDGSPGVRAATLQEVRERLGGVAAPVVLCGHSHMPRLAQCDRTLVVNPGSVGLQAFADDHAHRHAVETGTPLARWAVVHKDKAGGRWHAALHATPYDHERCARQAELAGRGDWADALRTGRVGRPKPR